MGDKKSPEDIEFDRLWDECVVKPMQRLQEKYPDQDISIERGFKLLGEILDSDDPAVDKALDRTIGQAKQAALSGGEVNDMLTQSAKQLLQKLPNDPKASNDENYNPEL